MLNKIPRLLLKGTSAAAKHSSVSGKVINTAVISAANFTTSSHTEVDSHAFLPASSRTLFNSTLSKFANAAMPFTSGMKYSISAPVLTSVTECGFKPIATQGVALVCKETESVISPVIEAVGEIASLLAPVAAIESMVSDKAEVMQASNIVESAGQNVAETLSVVVKSQLDLSDMVDAVWQGQNAAAMGGNFPTLIKMNDYSNLNDGVTIGWLRNILNDLYQFCNKIWETMLSLYHGVSTVLSWIGTGISYAYSGLSHLWSWGSYCVIKYPVITAAVITFAVSAYVVKKYHLLDYVKTGLEVTFSGVEAATKVAYYGAVAPTCYLMSKALTSFSYDGIDTDCNQDVSTMELDLIQGISAIPEFVLYNYGDAMN